MKKQTAKTRRQKLVSAKAAIFAVAGSLLLILAALSLPAINNQLRFNRINDIYASLKLDDSYLLQNENVFGDKRLYEWDKGRSWSSSKEYIRAASVDETANKLDKIIKAAGFEFIGEPYPGSTDIQYHYKSSRGEYIRLTVWSKPRSDTIQNKVLMGQDPTQADFAMDPNAGPSNVIIKVNLDDNNE